MARINQQLMARMEQKLGVGKTRLYSLIGDMANATNLPRNLAALALARERGLNVNLSKYATADELAELRHARIAHPELGASASANARETSRPRPRRSAPVTSKRASSRRTGTTVFVVHGRDEGARKAMFAFLRAIGLNYHVPPFFTEIWPVLYQTQWAPNQLIPIIIVSCILFNDYVFDKKPEKSFLAVISIFIWGIFPSIVFVIIYLPGRGP